MRNSDNCDMRKIENINNHHLGDENSVIKLKFNSYLYDVRIKYVSTHPSKKDMINTQMEVHTQTLEHQKPSGL